MERITDVSAWAIALLTGAVMRYGAVEPALSRNVLLAVPLAGALQIGIGRVYGLYDGRWRRGSFEEFAVLGKVSALVSLLLVLVAAYSSQRAPLTSLVGAFPLAVLLMGHVRYALRVRADRRLRPAPYGASRVVVVGAGEGGTQVVNAMLRSTTSPYLPVALLDDDPAKRRRQIGGIAVRGGREALEATVRATGADVVLIAIPSAGAELIQDVVARAEPLGLDVRVLPPIGEFFHRAVGVSDIRPVKPADLLERREAEIDVQAVAGYLTGRRVLVTGAGGSIGSELCRQVRRFGPASLVMLDRDESALHTLQLSMEGSALLDQRRLVVADIRDRKRLGEVFDEHRPDVVFHAAALKHLPLLEMYPGEAVKSNVFGTLNVLLEAQRCGVERLVNISTDKAADPVSVLGYSKRIAERLTAWSGEQGLGAHTSVRFGNVLGSRGSVLTAFEEQIRAGGPLTVTDPEVTRYFMTVEEAVQLVIQAGAVGRSGEVLVLDMGRPVRIADVARRLITRSGRPLDVLYTGLRPGEKLHETLLGQGEPDVRPVHRLISHVPVPPLSPDDLIAGGLDREELCGSELTRRLGALAAGSATPAGAAVLLDLHDAEPLDDQLDAELLDDLRETESLDMAQLFAAAAEIEYVPSIRLDGAVT